MFAPHNRCLGYFLDRVPSVADKLVTESHRLKIDMLRCRDDDGSIEKIVSYEIHGTLDEGDGDLLAALLRQFRTPVTEGGAE